jgi:NAD(P) transhydrogenase
LTKDPAVETARSFRLVVIGSGPAGQQAALQAARRGWPVALVERRQVIGGVCLHVGTIPSKTLRAAVLHLTGWRLRAIYGHAYAVKRQITMEDLLFRTHHVIDRELNVMQRTMDRHGVEVLQGEARFLDAHHVEVQGPAQRAVLRGDHVLVATGTTAYRPPNIAFDGETVIDSDEVLGMKALPRRMVILGAGVIGIEYASMFSTLDIEVTVISRSTSFFGFVDREITDALTYHLRQRGVTLRMGETVRSVGHQRGSAPTVVLESGKQLRPDLVMVASGRAGTAGQLDLAHAGVTPTDRGLLTVDEHFRTAVPHVYAAGDVIGFPSLASTAMEQGRRAACHMLGLPESPRQDAFPYGIYSIPEVAYIGRTEEELTAAGVPYETGVARYRDVAKGEIYGDDIGMLKMLFHRESRALLGVHVIGMDATELIHIGQAVLLLGGGLDYFLDSVFNYPTLAECYKLAALDAQDKLE